MIFSSDSIKNLAREAEATLRRFPLTLLCAITATVLVMKDFKNMPEDLARMVMALALGIPLFIFLELLADCRQHRLLNRWTLNGLGAVLLALFYFGTRHDMTVSFFGHYAQLSLALHLLVSVAPFIFCGQDENNENGFWQFNKAVFIRILFSGLYAAVLFFGLAACMATSDYLFDLKLDVAYGRLWLFCAGIFQTWFFLAGVPKNPSALEADRSYPKELKVFTQYLLIPLISLYMIILYFYMGKIILHWNLPKGSVGWLVSIMSVVGMFNLLLLEPVREKLENRWVRTYSKAFHLLLFPLIGMLFVGIITRIREYGITEPRYALVVLAAWLVAISVHLLLSPRRNIKIIPLSLAGLVLISSFGPWGAYQVSMRNQKHLLKKTLAANGLFADEKLQRTTRKDISEDVQVDVSSKFDYLIQHHGIESVKPWFNDTTMPSLAAYAVDSSDRARNSKPIMDILGLTYMTPWNHQENKNFYETPDKYIPVNIRSFAYLYHLDFNGMAKPQDLGEYSFTLLEQPPKIQIHSGQNLLATISLDPIIATIKENHAKPVRIKTTQEQLTLNHDESGLRLRLVIKNIGGTLGDSPVVRSLQGDLMMNTKK